MKELKSAKHKTRLRQRIAINVGILRREKHGTVGSQLRIEVKLYSNQVGTSRRHKYCGFNSRLEIVNKYIVDDSNKEVLKCTNTHCVKISYNLNPGGAMLLARLVQTSPSPF